MKFKEKFKLFLISLVIAIFILCIIASFTVLMEIAYLIRQGNINSDTFRNETHPTFRFEGNSFAVKINYIFSTTSVNPFLPIISRGT